MLSFEIFYHFPVCYILRLETITDGTMLWVDFWSNLVKPVLNPCDSPLLYSDVMLRYHHCTTINSVPLQCDKADLVKCRIKPNNGRTVTVWSVFEKWLCFYMANLHAIPVCYPSFRAIQPLLCNYRSSLRISLQNSTHFLVNELQIIYYLLKNNYLWRQLNVSRLKIAVNVGWKPLCTDTRYFFSKLLIQSSKINSMGLIQRLWSVQITLLSYCTLNILVRHSFVQICVKVIFWSKDIGMKLSPLFWLMWKHYLEKSVSTDFE